MGEKGKMLYFVNIIVKVRHKIKISAYALIKNIKKISGLGVEAEEKIWHSRPRLCWSRGGRLLHPSDPPQKSLADLSLPSLEPRRKKGINPGQFFLYRAVQEFPGLRGQGRSGRSLLGRLKFKARELPHLIQVHPRMQRC